MITRIGELGRTLLVTRNRSTQWGIVFLRRVIPLPVIANAPNSKILGTLLMVAMRCSETSVLTRVTQRNVLEDRIFLYFESLFRLHVPYQFWALNDSMAPNLSLTYRATWHYIQKTQLWLVTTFTRNMTMLNLTMRQPFEVGWHTCFV
jgi:hypothetical protein